VSVTVLRDTLKKRLPTGNSVIPTTASPLVSSLTTESETVVFVFDPESVVSRLEGDNADSDRYGKRPDPGPISIDAG